MTSATADTFRDLGKTPGAELGLSDWRSIDQRDADLFASLVGDWDAVHNDPEWARPRFGGAVASASQVLSLLPSFLKEIDSPIPAVATEDLSALNYGFETIRIMAPLLVGQRFRDRVTVVDVVEKRPGEFLVRTAHTIEREGEEKPHLVAEWMILVVSDYQSKWAG